MQKYVQSSSIKRMGTILKENEVHAEMASLGFRIPTFHLLKSLYISSLIIYLKVKLILTAILILLNALTIQQTRTLGITEPLQIIR